MKRGARLVVLDQTDPRNAEADYVVLEIGHAQLSPLIERLVQYLRVAEANRAQFLAASSKGDFAFPVRILVEAHHPRIVGKSPKDVIYPPSLLKDSIPRPGRS